MKLKLGCCICPKCNQDYNGLSVESCRSTEFSRIKCGECGFNYSGEFCEEDLTHMFFKKYNEKLKPITQR
jgi:transposase-like protein